MLILAIDTSSRMGSIALLGDGKLIAEISGHEETLYSMRLFRDLEALQSREKFRLDQIDVFAVAAGPGSFTGLRVGLTAVKAWAEVHGKPIAAVSGLEAVAAQSKSIERDFDDGSGVIAPFLDARRGQIFGSLYRREMAPPSETGSLTRSPSPLTLIGEESVFSAEEFVAMVKGTAQLVRPLFVSPAPEMIPADIIAQAFPGIIIEIEEVSPVLAPVIGRLGFEKAKRRDLVDALRLDANYVRRLDAESAWKDTK